MIQDPTSLYIHIPFCVSKCSYCDFFSIPTACVKNAIPIEYTEALCNEIKTRHSMYANCGLKTVYIGGGTPSLLCETQLNKISEALNSIGFSQDYEFTFEVNPDDVTKELLVNLEKAGVNRISCGIQSFSDNVLKSVQRRADSNQIYNCFEFFNKYWHKKLSVDLICGLPGETEKSLIQGLEFITAKKIPHISFYSLCVEEGTPLFKKIDDGAVEFDFDFCDELWIKGRDYLLSKGYEQYEVSNFCLKDSECLHNMTYWTHKSYIGAGSGATGTIYNFANAQDFRYTNTKNIEEYISFWKNQPQNMQNIPQIVEKISHQTSIFEYFMMGLRTTRGVSPVEFKNIFNEEMPPAVLETLKTKCSRNGDFYFLDKEQLLFLNTFLEDLLSVINRE